VETQETLPVALMGDELPNRAGVARYTDRGRCPERDGTTRVTATVTAAVTATVTATVTEVTGTDCVGWLYRRRGGGDAETAIMKCSLCHYVSSPDGPMHNARSCPLRQTQCRRSLPEGHPFREPGQCVSALCVHKEKCNTCGVTGHLCGTQALHPGR